MRSIAARSSATESRTRVTAGNSPPRHRDTEERKRTLDWFSSFPRCLGASVVQIFSLSRREEVGREGGEGGGELGHVGGDAGEAGFPLHRPLVHVERAVDLDLERMPAL